MSKAELAVVLAVCFAADFAGGVAFGWGWMRRVIDRAERERDEFWDDTQADDEPLLPEEPEGPLEAAWHDPRNEVLWQWDFRQHMRSLARATDALIKDGSWLDMSTEQFMAVAS